MPAKPLTHKQKAVLCQLAARAHKYTASPYHLDYFREQEQLASCDLHSLTHATQDHYIPLYNHFATLLHIDTLPDNTFTETKIWQHKIRSLQASNPSKFSKEYITAIASDKFNNI